MIEISPEEFLHITLAAASITGKMRKSCTIPLRRINLELADRLRVT
jgi:hypothetical protein